MDATTRFLDEPRRRFVEDAAATGLDVEPAGAVAERSWERLHPEGRADPVGEHGLRLWNFCVKEADLKPAHGAALDGFVRDRLWLLGTGATFHVEGHASATGAEAGNQSISGDRAERVAFAIAIGHRIPMDRIRSSAAGERRSLGGGESGEALARDRRVEVTFVVPARPTRRESDGDGQPPRPRPPGTDSSDLPLGEGFELRVTVGPVVRTTPVGMFELAGEFLLLRYQSGDECFRVRPEAKLKVGGSKPGTLELGAAFEVWLDANKSLWRLKLGDRSSLDLNLGEVTWSVLEVKPGAAFPFTTAVTVRDPFSEPVEYQGARFRVADVKIRIGYWPNPRYMAQLIGQGRTIIARWAPWARLPAGAGPVAAGAGVGLAYLGWVAWGMSKLEEAREEGQLWGILVHRNKGYAYRLAYVLTDMPDADGEAKLRELGPPDWKVEAGWIGWQIADIGWREIAADPAKVAALKGVLGAERHVPAGIWGTIYQLIGGAANRERLPHPEELIELARKRGLKPASTTR